MVAITAEGVKPWKFNGAKIFTKWLIKPLLAWDIYTIFSTGMHKIQSDTNEPLRQLMKTWKRRIWSTIPQCSQGWKIVSHKIAFQPHWSILSTNFPKSLLAMKRWKDNYLVEAKESGPCKKVGTGVQEGCQKHDRGGSHVLEIYLPRFIYKSSFV